MMAKIKPYSTKQGEHKSTNLSEWIPDDHLVRLVSDIVDQVDLSEITKQYSNRGEETYPPALLFKLLFYGYATGVLSSREICAAIDENIPFRWLCCGHKPDFQTISNFRKNHMKLLSGMFAQVVCIAMTKGYESFGQLSIDGSNLKATTTKHKATSQNRMKQEIARRESEIREVLEKAQQDDQEEESLPSPSPESVKSVIHDHQIRLQKIKHALQQLNQRKMPKTGIKKRSAYMNAKPVRSILFKTSISRVSSIGVQSRDLKVIPFTRSCRPKSRAMRAKPSIVSFRRLWNRHRVK